MSNPRIKAAFQDGKAFIPFVTCGDPNLETTKKIVAELAQAGAAVIELGIPFSDPTAEGPVIQSANMRALGAGTTTDKVFDMVAELRKTVDTPFVFMTYANVVFHYGIEKFCVRAAEAGVRHCWFRYREDHCRGRRKCRFCGWRICPQDGGGYSRIVADHSTNTTPNPLKRTRSLAFRSVFVGRGRIITALP